MSGIDMNPDPAERPSFLKMIALVAVTVAIIILVFFGIGYGFGRIFL
jgi:preprotein translocase subunit SecE